MKHTPFSSNTISSLLLKNGTASLKDLYPLVEVKTEADKKMLSTQGYRPGFTVDEWPYKLPVERIFYSKQLFPNTYYYDPDNAAIPIALCLNIYGQQRMPIIEDENEFCKYIMDFAKSLKGPSIDKVRSYLLAQNDGFRSELLAEYIRRSKPSPELYSLFIDYYTITDYGVGAYELPLLQKVFSGKSEEQKADTAAALANYPDVFTIYRGEAEGSTPYQKAFSWSLDINTAFFFACRHGDRNHARIIQAKAHKADIMAAFLNSSEKEVIVLPGAPFEVSKENLIGPDSLDHIKYLKEYHEGREMIAALYGTKQSENSDHDKLHSARVLFLAYTIIQTGKLKLSKSEMEQLRMAIVYHDIGRTNDAEDASHGAASRKVYEKHFVDPTVSFLIQYHCLDDQVAEPYLTTSRMRLLYHILKDADVLDRVRFGIGELDVNYLRLPISRKLVPLAVSAVHGIKM